MSDCIFLPNKPERNGYVRRGRGGPGRERSAHRQAYVKAYGPIPEGFSVDHTCHNEDLTCPGGEDCRHRACVNPDHLEAVPPRTNTLRSPTSTGGKNARKTHCAQGHEFTPGNTYVAPDKPNSRQCRMCKLLWRQRQIVEQRAREWGMANVGVIT